MYWLARFKPRVAFLFLTAGPLACAAPGPQPEPCALEGPPSPEDAIGG